MNAVAVQVGRNLRLVRTPQGLLPLVVQPLVFFAGFHAVLNRLLAARGVDVERFLAPAIVAQSMGFVAMSTAFLLAADKRSGLLARLRSLPIAPASVLAARLIADACRALAAVLVVVLAGHVAGFRFEGGPVAAAGFVALGVAFCVALAAGAAAVGLGVSRPEAVMPLLLMPFLLLLNLSTAFVPANAFPGRLRPVVEASPFSAVVEALRGLAGPEPAMADLWPAVLWVGCMTAGFGALTVRAYRRAV